MILLIAVHLAVPSIEYFPSYPSLVLSWFGFDWYSKNGWVVFLQYAFVGIPAFIYIGLPTILPILIVVLLLVHTKSRRRDQSIACLALALVLTAIYLDGWILYTWPMPYQLVQTISIVLVTILAYKNYRSNLAMK